MQKFFANLQAIKIENALYVVSTPIGNLNDITLRALKILEEVDFVLCEDSRVSMQLLKFYNIKDKKLLIYNDHSNQNDRQRVLEILNQGKSVALISDAGTPLISDPGYKLINFLNIKNKKIISVPGASALTSAISISGIACNQFLFLGFLPNSGVQKEKIIKNTPSNYSSIFFESANRCLETLEIVNKINDNEILVSVVKEITKIHEEVIFGKIEYVIDFFNKNPDKLKGEFVIIIQKNESDNLDLSKDEIIENIKKLLKQNKSAKDISTEISFIYGINKKEIYKIVLKLINDNDKKKAKK